MRSLVVLLLVVPFTSGFVPQPSSACSRSRALHGYVPDGLSKAQYDKLKRDEAAKKAKKDFGRGGARGFESRSMQSFVAALERGEAKHLMPVDPSKVQWGEIALKDVPYMQRGGCWDNKDLKNGKGWMNTGFGMKAFNDGKAKILKKNKYDDKYK